MLLPEKMTKVLMVGPRGHLRDTIEALYELEATHIVDYKDGDHGLRLGSPLPESSPASAKLLKLRSLEKDLGTDEVKVSEQVSVSKIEAEADAVISGLEKEIATVADSRNEIQSRITELETQKAQLALFDLLPLPLELYHGYSALRVFTGRVRTDPTAAIAEAVPESEAFVSKDGAFVALFVRKENADKAMQALVPFGYTEVPAPAGSGAPSQTITVIQEELVALRVRLEEAVKRINDMRDGHAALMKATDEHLSIIVEKAETPLRAGTTDRAFVLDAWVPTKNLENVIKSIEGRFKGAVHLEVLETRGRREKGGHGTNHHAPAEEGDEAPTQLNNGRTAGKFEFLIRLLSLPKYKEIDPTWLMMITLPIFFGLMVGDIGYGIPFIILGYLGLRRCVTPEWRIIATLLFFGGIWATIFGMFLFGEALGLHFAEKHGEITWSSLLGLHLPHYLFVEWLPLGVLSKLHDVGMLLYISVWIGIVHIFVGFALGFYNKAIRYGLRHAVEEKMSWLLILVGGALLFLLLIDAMIRGMEVSSTDLRIVLAVPLILIGVVLAYRGEGATAILELPGLMGNVISYTRIAAIGMSKAGLALAFNTIAFEVMLGHDPLVLGSNNGDIVMTIVALVIFAVGHLTIFVLAVLSGGLHSLRLHYVECFMKFYEGGGVEFKPLKVIRKYTRKDIGIGD